MFRKIQQNSPKQARKKLPKIRYLIGVIGVAVGSIVVPTYKTDAESCPDVKFVFARGSGGERWNDKNYLSFKEALEDKLRLTSINYEFEDLDYPAIGVGVDEIWTTLGAYFGAGDAYEFGKSVDAGVQELMRVVNNGACINTKYVIAGYSQGAMVVSKALGSLNADKIIYAATFGDPKIYLPEGAGIIPPACRGENLSNYRAYVPDCQAYEGLLGSYRPYQPAAYIDKLGTWCNRADVFCSSHFNVSDHVSYVDDLLYEDASRMIFSKITSALRVENHYTSPHDTAIVIDSTGSMKSLISQYKAEALRLAEKTLESGGRVALYDYRDLADPYEPVMHCDFESCDLTTFAAGLDSIEASGGGDTPESLLSATLTVMKELKWKFGSTKSVVVLTDTGYHQPDLDGTDFVDVVKLSKTIDPVNIYVITKPASLDKYAALTEATGGRVVTTSDDLAELTNYIMERHDSLPVVEEDWYGEKPTLKVETVEAAGDDAVRVRFSTNGVRTAITVNDAVLGITNDSEVIIAGIDRSMLNTVGLTPLSEDMRGDRVVVELNAEGIPGTPNTGVGLIGA